MERANPSTLLEAMLFSNFTTHVSDVIDKMMHKIANGYVIYRGRNVSIRLRRSITGVRYPRVFKFRTSERRIIFHDNNEISCECPVFGVTGVPCWHLIFFNMGNLEPEDIHPRYLKCNSSSTTIKTFSFRIKNRRPPEVDGAVYVSADTSDTEGEVSDDFVRDEDEDMVDVLNEVHDLYTSTGVRNLFRDIHAEISTVPGNLYSFGSAMVQWRQQPRQEYPSSAPSSVAGRQGSRIFAGRRLSH
jgi:hypothetical protein